MLSNNGFQTNSNDTQGTTKAINGTIQVGQTDHIKTIELLSKIPGKVAIITSCFAGQVKKDLEKMQERGDIAKPTDVLFILHASSKNPAHANLTLNLFDYQLLESNNQNFDLPAWVANSILQGIQENISIIDKEGKLVEFRNLAPHTTPVGKHRVDNPEQFVNSLKLAGTLENIQDLSAIMSKSDSKPEEKLKEAGNYLYTKYCAVLDELNKIQSFPGKWQETNVETIKE
ncbi:hypothetical protein [Candidatus Trichorickettsia mobilis]|uniref:hypothetical protein n=1 Tax=Candidatus Trichorickettsia mobilis TaxID=1346319 RepID=UPI00292EBCA3|nr:hypothetical protein [Candidatus Trichorickettsia mobilis]